MTTTFSDPAARHAALDVAYGADRAVGACVVFHPWDAAAAEIERFVTHADPAPYRPGAFAERELPILLSLLAAAPTPPDTVVVDAYVDLGPGRPGLGRRLYDALGGGVAVIGVAKTRFAGAVDARAVSRGGARPVFVTAAGVSNDAAAEAVARLHGPYRIPTLLRRVDRLCRDALAGRA